MMDIKALSSLMQSRRSVFPKQYIDKEIPDEVILQILENANWAPNHRNTEPWRFKVFKEKGLQVLSDYLGDRYVEKFKGDSYSEFKHKKTVKKPLQCAVIIGLCMQRDPSASVPEWEEVAALACAVQNMWLSCTALGIGSYWSTPSLITGKNDVMDLAEGESCYGLFYMGYWSRESIEAQRGKIKDKIQWIRE